MKILVLTKRQLKDLYKNLLISLLYLKKSSLKYNKLKLNDRNIYDDEIDILKKIMFEVEECLKN